MIKLLKSVEKQPGISVSMVWDIRDAYGFRPRRKRFYSFVHSSKANPEIIAGLATLTVQQFEMITYTAAQKRFVELAKTQVSFRPSTNI